MYNYLKMRDRALLHAEANLDAASQPSRKSQTLEN